IVCPSFRPDSNRSWRKIRGSRHDFDVFKALTALRNHEGDSYNQVLRRLLALPDNQENALNALLSNSQAHEIAKALSNSPAPKNALAAFAHGAWFNGVFFPDGTKLRATYKGAEHFAEIRNGQWVDANGVVRTSPSDAASAISGTNVNGWRFWHAWQPTQKIWRRLDDFQ
ncbi:DUF4357 domain-containing protein, partial [Porphyrobacter sp. AAP82]|uniref:DUF4357 domain-containing protein n=1 Tax=Porphyrobacter sp. AAP82 TaxID=1248917 RepID=UPI001F16FEED